MSINNVTIREACHLKAKAYDYLIFEKLIFRQTDYEWESMPICIQPKQQNCRYLSVYEPISILVQIKNWILFALAKLS